MKAIEGTNWGYPDLKHVMEVETESETETKLVMGIKTLLDTVSIAL
jgi:hypothetical protein